MFFTFIKQKNTPPNWFIMGEYKINEKYKKVWEQCSHNVCNHRPIWERYTLPCISKRKEVEGQSAIYSCELSGNVKK